MPKKGDVQKCIAALHAYNMQKIEGAILDHECLDHNSEPACVKVKPVKQNRDKSMAALEMHCPKAVLTQIERTYKGVGR